MRLLIVDDEPRALEVLRHMLSKVSDVQVVGEASTGLEAVEFCRRESPDAVFLDIRMPDLDGVEAARLIRAASPGVSIVFVTAYEEYAVPAFDLEAADYLVKPLNTARVLQAVERLRRRPTADAPVPRVADRVTLETTQGNTRRTVFLDPGQILALEAAGKHTTIRTLTGEFTVAEGLSELASRLPATQFLRVHRGYVVNLSSVRELFTDGRTFAARVEGLKAPIPVSRERVGLLKESLGSSDN
jgi:DNA-binding LytR/AlgR family response regulator